MNFFNNYFKNITSIMDQNESEFKATHDLWLSYKRLDDMIEARERSQNIFKYFIIGLIFSIFVIIGIIELFLK